MAQSYRTNIQPQNGTGANLGETIIINIPTSNNIVLAPTESYLKFKCVITNDQQATPAVWDSCGAHGLIQRIRIFHGSNLLQDVDSYNLLAKMLFDLQVSTDSSYGRFNQLVGTRNDLITVTPAVPAVGAGLAVPAINATVIPCRQINSGDYYSLAAYTPGPPVVYTSETRYFCLNLISLLGTLSPSQYIPLFAMTTAPLRLEIQLVSNAYNAIASVTPLRSVVLSEIEYIANFIKLSDGAMDVIYGSLQGQPLEFSVSDYSNYQYSYTQILAQSPTQINFAIPAKYSSLKSIFVTIRDQFNTPAYLPFSSISAELLKAMGSMSDLNYEPSIERISYELDRSTAITAINYTSTNSGSFYIGIDLENYVSAPKDTMFAGYNSNTDDIFAVINLTPPAGVNITPRFDAFALFDATITFINGTAIRSF
eukprot:gene16855-23094_t